MQVGNNHLLFQVEALGDPIKSHWITLRANGGSPVRLMRLHDMTSFGLPVVSGWGLKLGIPSGLPIEYLGPRAPLVVKSQGWIKKEDLPPETGPVTGFGFIDSGVPGEKGTIIRVIDDNSSAWIEGQLVDGTEIKGRIVLGKWVAKGDVAAFWLGYGSQGYVKTLSPSDDRISGAYVQ